MIKILIVFILVLPAILFLAIYLLTNPTSSSYLSKISIPVSKKNLYESVAALVDTEQFRNYLNTRALNQAAEFIQEKFEASGGRVDIQEYGFGDNLYKNVICSFGPENGERIVIGAHYDVCEHQPGADDNANDTRWRRFRFGFISGFGGGYTIQLEADLDLNNDLGSLYNRLTDAYVGYRRVFFRFTCQRGSRRALGVSGGRIQWGRQRGNRPRQCRLLHPPVTGIRLLP